MLFLCVFQVHFLVTMTISIYSVPVIQQGLQPCEAVKGNSWMFATHDGLWFRASGEQSRSVTAGSPVVKFNAAGTPERRSPNL